MGAMAAAAAARMAVARVATAVAAAAVPIAEAEESALRPLPCRLRKKVDTAGRQGFSGGLDAAGFLAARNEIAQSLIGGRVERRGHKLCERLLPDLIGALCRVE